MVENPRVVPDVSEPVATPALPDPATAQPSPPEPPERFDFLAADGSGPGWSFDRGAWQLCRDGEEVAVPPRALAVLAVLLAAAGRVVAKADLLERVWRETHVGEDSLSEAVRILRQALGDDSQRALYVQTVHRLGYRFVGQLRPGAPPAAMPGAAEPSGAAAAPAGGRATEVAPDEVAEPAPPAGERPRRSADGSLRRVDQRTTRIALPILAVVLLALLLGGFGVWWLRPDAAPASAGRLLHLQIALPDGLGLDVGRESIALLPSGDELLLLLSAPGEPPRIYRRRLDRSELELLTGTSGAEAPFVAPEGGRLGFIAPGGSLSYLALAGGVAVPVAVLSGLAMPSWSVADRIVATRLPSGGIWGQPLDGRPGALLTEPSAADGEFLHLWPQDWAAPRGVLYNSWGGQLSRSRLVWRTQDASGLGPPRVLVEAAVAGRLVHEPGREHPLLVYVAAGNLVAARVDLGRARLVSPPVPLLRDVAQGFGAELPQVAVSAETLAVVLPAPAPSARLLRRYPDGRIEELPHRVPGAISFASDAQGTELAFAMRDREAGDVWTTTPGAAGAGPEPPGEVRLERLSFGVMAHYPLLVPGGSGVLVSGLYQGSHGIFLLDRQRPGHLEQWRQTARRAFPCAITADGQWVVYAEATPPGPHLDLWMVARGDEEPRRLTSAPTEEWACGLSPDGRWLAYSVVEQGKSTVRAAGFPDLSGPREVSPQGGDRPAFSPDGATLFYLERQGRLMAVAWPPGDGPAGGGSAAVPGSPVVFHEGAPVLDYAPLVDGSVLVLEASALAERVSRVEVLVGWRTLLADR
jgi:DNA-binding winged helix-turn-helix (wHTH) protein